MDRRGLVRVLALFLVWTMSLAGCSNIQVRIERPVVTEETLAEPTHSKVHTSESSDKHSSSDTANVNQYRRQHPESDQGESGDEHLASGTADGYERFLPGGTSANRHAHRQPAATASPEIHLRPGHIPVLRDRWDGLRHCLEWGAVQVQ